MRRAARRAARRTPFAIWPAMPIPLADTSTRSPMRQLRALLPRAITAALVALLPEGATAQGFALNEIGTCAVGRAFAVVAAPCGDASVLFWNPALASRLPGRQIYAGLAAIQLNGAFRSDASLPPGTPGPAGTRSEAAAPVEYPPYAFANFRMTPRLALGVGFYVPYGLTTQWGDDFAGRFVNLRAALTSVYVQPNVAFDLVPGRFAIGGGPVLARSSVELEQALDLRATGAAVPPGTEFARSSIVGDAVATGFHVGAHATVTPALTVGVRYLSEVEFDYEGDVVFRQIATGIILPEGNPYGAPAGTPLDTVLASRFGEGRLFSTQMVRTSIAHPAQLQAGIALGGAGRNRVMVDYAWYGWSSFRELAVRFDSAALDRSLIEDYEDSHAVRVAWERRSMGDWTVRAGVGYVGSPAPDETVTPLLPDQERLNVGLGLTRLMGQGFLLDLSYLRVQGVGRRGRVVERTDRAQTAATLNSGRYDLDADVLSVGLKVLFQ